MGMVQFYSVANLANFPVSPNSDALYFVEDAKRIYKGATDITEKVQLVSTFADTGVFPGILYVNTVDGVAKVRNAANTAWINVTISNLNAFLTGVTYSYDDTNGPKITITKNGATLTQLLTGILYNPQYDTDTMQLTFSRLGEDGPYTVNLPKDNFVRSGSYNTSTQTIDLVVGDGTNTQTISIPAADLVDIYTAGDTATIDLNVDNNNEFTGTVKISATTGNIITANSDGLFAAETDISGKVDKVTTATANDIATFVAGGNVQDSGKVIGGATLAATPNANTVATEAAVAAAIEAALTWH